MCYNNNTSVNINPDISREQPHSNLTIYCDAAVLAWDTPLNFERDFYLVDSGCTKHLAATAENLLDVAYASGNVITAGGGSLRITGVGRNPRFPGLVYIVPGLQMDLIAFHQLEEEGLRYGYINGDLSHQCRTWTKPDGERIYSLDFCIYANGMGLLPKGPPVYPENFPFDPSEVHIRAGRATKLNSTTAVPGVRIMVELLHAFGHYGQQAWEKALSLGFLQGIPSGVTPATFRKYYPNCKYCVLGMAKKVTADRAPKGRVKARHPVAEDPRTFKSAGDMVYVDVCDFGGREGAQYSEKGERYAILFKDAATKQEFTVHTINRTQILMAQKSAIAYWAMHGHRIRTFQSDNEFTDSCVVDLLSRLAITIKLSAPHEKHQNGDAERAIGIATGHTRAIMAAAHPSLQARKYWPSAWNHQQLANNCLRQSPCSDTPMSSWEAFTGEKPDVTKWPLLPWGCMVESLIPNITNNSLPRTEPAFNLGVSVDHQNVLQLVTARGTRCLRRSYWQMSSPLESCSFGEEVMPPQVPLTWLDAQPQLVNIYNGRQDTEIPLRNLQEAHEMGKEDTLAHNLRRRSYLDKVDKEKLERANRLLQERSDKNDAAWLAKQHKQSLSRKKKNDRELARQNKSAARQSRQRASSSLTTAEDKDSARPYNTRNANSDTKGRWSTASMAVLGHDECDKLTATAFLKDCPEAQFKILQQNLPLMLARDKLRSFRLNRARKELRDEHKLVYAQYRCSLAHAELATEGAFSASLKNADPTLDVIPKGYKKMLASPEAKQWQEAIAVEIDQLKDKLTWTVVEGGYKSLKKGTPVYRSSFVFNKKYNPSTGTLEKYKARLVLDGSHQTGMTDEDTYSPTVSSTTVKLVVAVSVAKRMKMSLLDVGGAFLIEDIDKETFMSLPLAYTDGVEVIVKLSKSLYGLRQAPRLFSKGMTTHLQSMGFTRALTDNCLYIKGAGTPDVCYICVHVDDLLISGKSVAYNEQVRDQIQKKYRKISWHSQCTEYLGINLVYNSDGSVTMNQPAYRRNLLARFGMPSDMQQITTPHRTQPIREGDNDLIKGATDIRAYVGAAQYASGTAPEIACVLNQVAKQMHTPTKSVLEDAFTILQYLATNPDKGITYRATGCTHLQAWVDASWLSEPNSSSRTGYCTTLGNESRDPIELGTGIISSYSKVQSLAALSSTHSEIIALSECLREVLHLRMMLGEMGLKQPTTPVYEDNNGAISFAQARPDVARSKHILIKDRFCVEAVEQGWAEVLKIPTLDHVADMFTKLLSESQFVKFTRQILGSGI